MSIAPETPRWAQLTYASLDPGNGAGGWQVKESRGDLTPAELRGIAAHLVTTFDAHVTMPEYPTPDDIAAQPRRCMHLLGYDRAIGSGAGPAATVTAGCTIHAVQAGIDSTGRPGNVFSHAVLDRRPAEPAPRWRPIEVWRSFDLLTPYGTDQVLAATLRHGDYPQPSGLVGRDLVLEFVFDPSTWRMGVLSVLLDAVDASIRGGRRVVLLTSSPDHAALWIGAVSWCMAASTARALSWSVYERAARILSVVDRGVHIACVPHDDADRLDPDAPGVVVIDDREFPSLGQLGGAPHRTAAGHDVAVTPWSALAQESLIDGPTASGVLALVDEVADRLPGRFLTPAWPLAMAHLMSASSDSDTSIASRVAVVQAPVGDLDPAITAYLLDAVSADLGDGVADAWAALAAAPAGSQQAAIGGVEYVRRALADADWLTRPGGVPVPEGVSVGAADGDLSVADAYARALMNEDPAVVLRAADVGVRARLTDDPEVRRATVEALRDRVAPRLLRRVGDGQPSGPASTVDDTSSIESARAVDDSAAEPSTADSVSAADPSGFVTRVGLLDPRIHLELVPEAVAALLSGSDEAGCRGAGSVFAPAVATWLIARGLPARRDDGDDAVRIELADWALRTDAPVAGAGKTLADALLERYGSWNGIPSELRVVEPRHLWHADELVSVERAHPGGLPAVFFEPSLACAPPSRELTALAELITLRHGTREARVARLRLEAESIDSKPASLSPTEVLDVAAAIWSTYHPHAAAEVFGPIVVESAVRGAAELLDDRAWPSSWFAVVLACSEANGVTARVVANIARRLASVIPATPDALGVAAGVVAIDVATSPANAARICADAALSDQARGIGRLTDHAGRRFIELIVDAIVATGVDRQALTAESAVRLAEAERRGDMRVAANREAQLAALIDERFREADARRAGTPGTDHLQWTDTASWTGTPHGTDAPSWTDGWIRPFRAPRSKEP